MSYYAKRLILVLLFVLLLVIPLVIMLLAPQPAGRQFWRDGAVAMGFLGLALMGWQFVPPARLHFLTEVIDLDQLYNMHHRLSRISLFLVLVHPIILIVGNPYNFVAFDVFSGVWKLAAGAVAFTLMVVLVGTSVWRQWLRMSYEAWHVLHDVLAGAVLAFALYHIFSVGHFTAQPLQRILWIVYGVVWFGMLLYVRLITPLRMIQRPWELVEIIEERAKTWTLAFAPVGHEGMEFRAGQTAWLTIGDSAFGYESHPFSFASSAMRPERLEFAIRELGDWTSQIMDYPIGTRAYVDGPYGTFDLDHHPGSEYTFIAGGIGSAPIMSMLRTMAETNDDRPLKFFYGNKSWEGIAFREELDRLEQILNLKVIHVLEDAHEGWEGETGFISADVMRRYITDCSTCIYFICGPIPMINFVTGELEKMEVPRDQVTLGPRQLVRPQGRVYVEQYEMA
jgi:predicted ferric reductase